MSQLQAETPTDSGRKTALLDQYWQARHNRTQAVQALADARRAAQAANRKFVDSRRTYIKAHKTRDSEGHLLLCTVGEFVSLRGKTTTTLKIYNDHLEAQFAAEDEVDRLDKEIEQLMRELRQLKIAPSALRPATVAAIAAEK